MNKFLTVNVFFVRESTFTIFPTCPRLHRNTIPAFWSPVPERVHTVGVPWVPSATITHSSAAPISPHLLKQYRSEPREASSRLLLDSLRCVMRKRRRSLRGKGRGGGERYLCWEERICAKNSKVGRYAFTPKSNFKAKCF